MVVGSGARGHFYGTHLGGIKQYKTHGIFWRDFAYTNAVFW